MNTKNKCSVILSGILLFASITATQLQAEIGFQGMIESAQVTDANGNPIDLTTVDSIPDGATINTPPGVSLTITLPDGSSIDVKPGSSITILSASAGNSAVYVNSGSIVVDNSGSSGSIQIETPTGKTEVKSGKAQVNTTKDADGSTSTEVENLSSTGSVTTNEGGTETDLSIGDTTSSNSFTTTNTDGGDEEPVTPPPPPPPTSVDPDAADIISPT